VALDLIRSLPPSRRGKVYLLVMQDCYPKWVEPPYLTSLLWSSLRRYGAPRILHQDNGFEFTADVDVFMKLCKLLCITQTTTTPYYPNPMGKWRGFTKPPKTCSNVSVQIPDAIGQILALGQPELTELLSKRAPNLRQTRWFLDARRPCPWIHTTRSLMRSRHVQLIIHSGSYRACDSFMRLQDAP
jgi:hypothetical protein